MSVVVEPVGRASREVDAELAHRVDHLRMHVRRGPAPRRAGLVPRSGALEQRLGHLRPAGVLDADEEDAAHVAASCPEMNPYVTTASTAPRAGAAR